MPSNGVKRIRASITNEVSDAPNMKDAYDPLLEPTNNATAEFLKELDRINNKKKKK